MNKYIFIALTVVWAVFPSTAFARDEQSISGMVVPHHDLVKARRERAFAEVKKRIASQPQTIILVSPNHFNAGRANAQMSTRIWKTSVGDIAPDTELMNALADARVASEEPEGFDKEHGIKLLLKDIKRTFPDARIVPLILKETMPQADVVRLYDSLRENCASCFLVASVDFSHYQPAALAELHDTLALRGLHNADADLLFSKAEVDSPQSLSLLASWAKNAGTEKFILFDRTNSGILAGNPDSETTSHMFAWYERGEPIRPEKSVTFAIAGDMMFGRSVAHAYKKKYTDLFSRFGNRVFWGTDAALANLEGPISDRPVPDDVRPNNLVFNFPPQTIKALEFLRLTGVSLANNHTDNKGLNGLATTRQILKKAGIRWFGDPRTVDEATIMRIEGQGLRLHIIGVHALLPKVPDITPLIKKIKKDSKNKVIVFPHWGTEYAVRHSKPQERLSHAWIDAGADAVIGAHPHVIQDMEAYHGRPVIYSMGNFVFDQLFSKQTQEGILVAGAFRNDGLELFALPHRSRSMRPEIIRGKDKKKILGSLYDSVKKYLRTTSAGDILYFPL